MDKENTTQQQGDEQKFSFRDELDETLDQKKEKNKEKKNKDKNPERSGLWKWLVDKFAPVKPVEGGELPTDNTDKPRWLEFLNGPHEEALADASKEAPIPAEASTLTAPTAEAAVIAPVADRHPRIAEPAIPKMEATSTAPVESEEREEPFDLPTIVESAPIAPSVDEERLVSPEPPAITETAPANPEPAEEELVIDHGEPVADSATGAGETYYGYGYDRRMVRYELDRRMRELERERRRDKHELKHELRKEHQAVERATKKTLERPLPPAPAVVNVERQPVGKAVEQARSTPVVRPEQPVVQSETKPQSIERPVSTPVETLVPQRTEVLGSQPSPEVIAKQVMEAADHNEPVERLIERSHEIKDTDYQSSPVPLSQVMDEVRRRLAQTTPISADQAPPQTTPPSIMPPSQATTEDLYHAAMRWGFWVAAALVVLALIAYLVLH